MLGETDLRNLLASMEPELQKGEFVFCTNLEPASVAKLKPIMQFQEAEGLTAIIHLYEAKRLNIAYEFCCRQIILKVHSSLNAVGFLATITATLASCNISVNPVSAFHHDHLFVPSELAETALSALLELAQVTRESRNLGAFE